MLIQPNTDITLYSGVDIGTCQQLAFSSHDKQRAYFQTKILKQYVKCTVVKEKMGVIKVAINPAGQASAGEITGAELASANYMSFVNQSFDNKTIYCYIVDYVYLNNETAEIRYMVDYWQTWMFDVTFDPMYIDREHLSQADWDKVEENPYRSDVPQMITREPLPTPMGYEKPFYSVNYWHDPDSGFDVAEDDSLDGRALMHTSNTVNQLISRDWVDTAYSMLEGDWNYWNVMLIQAPTDWTKFNIYDTYSVGAIIKYTDDNFYKCNQETGNSSFEPSKWDPLTVLNNPPVQGTTSLNVSPGGYVLDKDENLYYNSQPITTPFNPSIGAANIGAGFVHLIYTEFAGSIEQEYLNILERNHIVVAKAGELTVNGMYPYSCKPKGCDILFIDDCGGWEELAKFYTKYNAVSQIIGIFGVPLDAINYGHAMGLNGIGTKTCSSTASAFRTSLNTEGKQEDVKNKKLLTSPFSYYRVICPDGNIKEYSYENFADLADGSSNGYFGFKIALDTSGDTPKLYLIPHKYKTNNEIPESIVNGLEAKEGRVGEAFAKAIDFNLDEAICIGGFPEISFNTDGYLSFLASEYTSLRANTTMDTALMMNQMDWNTDETKNAIKAVLGGLGSMGSGLVSGWNGGKGGVGGALVGGLTGFAEGAYNVMDAAGSSAINREIYENQKKKYYEAAEYVNGDLLSTDDPYIERFKFVKPAYANSNYVGGNAGVISYLRGMGLFDFVGIHVQLRPEILDYYDKWFDLYGYSSGRCGIPYVIQFCRGGSELPHWVGSDGIIPDTTYVKTFDCKVEHAMMPVAQAIKQMFDAGIRMKKGDLS